MRILAGWQNHKLMDYFKVDPRYWLKVILTINGRGKVDDIFVLIMNLTIYIYLRKSIHNTVKKWLKRGYLDSEYQSTIQRWIYLPKWAWEKPAHKKT